MELNIKKCAAVLLGQRKAANRGGKYTQAACIAYVKSHAVATVNALSAPDVTRLIKTMVPAAEANLLSLGAYIAFRHGNVLPPYVEESHV
jgi:hypothetical protein